MNLEFTLFSFALVEYGKLFGLMIISHAIKIQDLSSVRVKTKNFGSWSLKKLGLRFSALIIISSQDSLLK